MNLSPDSFPDYPGFADAYNEMNRADRKAEMKRQRKEVPYGSDSPLWATIDEHGQRVSQHEWYVKMPSDQLSAKVSQAQNYLFALIADKKKQVPGSERHRKVVERMREQNSLIDYLQFLLLHPESRETVGCEA